MTAVLICARKPLPDLYDTLVWRDDVERRVAPNLADALREAASAPQLVIVDAELPEALELIEALRARPATRKLPVAVVASGSVDAALRRTLGNVANALLEPPSSGWDEQLEALTAVSARRDVRVPVRLEFDAQRGSSRVTGVAHNLSESGMRVECVLALRVGERLGFALTLPDSEQQVRGRGQVVREQRPNVGGVTSYGVRFVSLASDAAQRINAVIAAAAQPAAARRRPPPRR